MTEARSRRPRPTGARGWMPSSRRLRLQAEQGRRSTANGPPSSPPTRKRTPAAAVTGVDVSISDIGRKITKVPDGFRVTAPSSLFWKIVRKRSDNGVASTWATGEALLLHAACRKAFTSAVGTGQRPRHVFRSAIAVLIDQQDESRYTPFNHLGDEPGHYEVINRYCPTERCSASSTAIRWPSEGAGDVGSQFGDFANGAQVLFDSVHLLG